MLVRAALGDKPQMSQFQSAFLQALDARGYIKQTTHQAELDAYCMTGVPVAYIGFDATADSLHDGCAGRLYRVRRHSR